MKKKIIFSFMVLILFSDLCFAYNGSINRADAAIEAALADNKSSNNQEQVTEKQTSENILKKRDFQKAVNKLVTPYFMRNNKKSAVDGKSFQQAYTEWENKITYEYERIKREKIAQYNSLQQYVNEASQQEKLYSAYIVLAGMPGELCNEQYWIVDGYYIHDYRLFHTNYRCSHSSLEELNKHIYWIEQCNMRSKKMWNMLEDTNGEVVEYFYDISENKNNKIVKDVLEDNEANPTYNQFNLSNFYKQKLAELNNIIAFYEK